MCETLICSACPNHCALKPGDTGACLARKNTGAAIECVNYALATSLALDPIEKKPLFHFHPGTKILSVGSFGCNLKCPFCQNHDISQAGEGVIPTDRILPEELAGIAENLRDEEGNIGVAFTYNEPLTGYEYVRDCAVLLKEKGLCAVAVTNGHFEIQTLDAVLPYIDAFNIDLKGFTQKAYDRLGGKLETVKAFIMHAHVSSHIEITSLIVPGINDSVTEMEEEAKWIAAIDPGIPLHINRYFPRYRYRESATAVPLLQKMKSAAERYLEHVYIGNV